MRELTAGRLLRRSFRRHRGRIAAGVVLLAGHQSAEALMPVLIGVIIDRAVGTGDVAALVVWIGALCLLFACLTTFWRWGARHLTVAKQRETHLLRIEVVQRVLDPCGHGTGLRAGEVLQVATSDAERAGEVLEAGLITTAAGTALTVSAVSLLAIDVPLAFTVLVGVPVLVAGLQVLSPRLTRRAAAAQAAAGETTALATDLVRGVRALRGIGAEASAARLYRASSRATLRASLRAATTGGVYEGLTAAVSGLFLAAVAGVAGWFALAGRITIGELITVVGLAQFVAEPVRLLGMAGQLVAQARASAQRLVPILTAPRVLTPGSRTDVAAAADVRLSGVSYRTLAGLTLSAGPAEIVGVVCHEQRDYEALLALLSGTVPATAYRGTLTIGGVPAVELDLAAHRGTVLVEQHDVALFEGTLRSNLTAGGALAHGRLEAAVRAAAVEDVVAAGLDHPVADRGTTLSGGQRQRIGLARALAANPPVLVLHEPTTAVDAVTEERIAQGIAKLRAGSTTLLLTTSPALLAITDRVVVLDGGRVVAAGTHAELAESDPRYRGAVLR